LVMHGWSGNRPTCYEALLKRAIDFTADFHEVEGKPIAKRGRMRGVTPNPRLKEGDVETHRRASGSITLVHV